jgi:HD-GYP domain-containing protein (c-di-GMP phosphodiesterase class II)
MRPLKLRHILFGLLLVSGIVPLIISAFFLIGNNREVLTTQQTELLTASAQTFARLVSDDLTRRRELLRQLGDGVLAAPGPRSVEARLRQSWVTDLLGRFAAEHPEFLSLRAVDRKGQGPSFDRRQLGEVADAALRRAFEGARDAGEPVYQFARLPQYQTPTIAIAIPVLASNGTDVLVLHGLGFLPLEAAGLNPDKEIFLVDAAGEKLWGAGQEPMVEQALLESNLVSGFVDAPLALTRTLSVIVDGSKRSILARIVPVEEPGWGLVAHRSTEAAFAKVQVMVKTTILISVVSVILALTFALMATRWLSRPIQRLAETSHEIATGHFDRRVPTEGMTLEVVELAEDFNRMSDYLENYIERLRRAATANRELFISSIRAFAAAIDAKDPYTRGHSERVARYSRAIARYLGLPKDIQERVWISAVLHDIGKIGVEDQVLLKMGRLTDEEFDKMKQHPVIGADIVEPISALRDMLPGIRWHHEAWNGGGYPDGLKGEAIPMMARIIGVADTFDAITTNRPYQTASPPEFALKTIKKLTGTRFDARIVTAFLLAYEANHIRMDPVESQKPAPVGAPPSVSPTGSRAAQPSSNDVQS